MIKTGASNRNLLDKFMLEDSVFLCSETLRILFKEKTEMGKQNVENTWGISTPSNFATLQPDVKGIYTCYKHCGKASDGRHISAL